MKETNKNKKTDWSYEEAPGRSWRRLTRNIYIIPQSYRWRSPRAQLLNHTENGQKQNRPSVLKIAAHTLPLSSFVWACCLNDSDKDRRANGEIKRGVGEGEGECCVGSSGERSLLAVGTWRPGAVGKYLMLLWCALKPAQLHRRPAETLLLQVHKPAGSAPKFSLKLLHVLQIKDVMEFMFLV